MIRKYSILFILLFLSNCGGGGSTGDDDIKPPPTPDEEIIVIPTVVHVLYRESNPETNISDEKIESQFTVLNQDFRGLNPDIINVPGEFTEYVADTKIEFQLASVDPEGAPSTGITRTLDQLTSFDDIYFSNAGGKDAWPTDRYLNIWIIDGNNRNGIPGQAGYAQFPGGDPLTDGVVIIYQAFGTLEPLFGSYRLGRTATHEIGHWLNLLHIYGEGGSCEVTDLVDDTPTALNVYDGVPVHPANSCGSNDMFMNFMDGSNDESLIMFTKGQKERMRAVFEPGGGRSDLYENSKAGIN